MLQSRIQEELIECGTDEAGRGCLAGPVTAAAVILPPDYDHPILNDSKQLSTKQRNALRIEIQREAISYQVCHIHPKEIDQINILKASILAMQRSILQLDPQPGFIAVDGNKFIELPGKQHQCVIKGDSRYLHIAAASVLAKTYRDEYMARIASEFPQYGWESNKGYPTASHREAISEFGPTPYHRMSFKLLPTQLKLEL
ncbi:ribonuclease HII [Aureitalea marina]|uniref:Ribonuclease HII n=1 Tax=Aureitalea marina TaxID=930804 RepID=A0A2S7KQU7_9FLAO|nr:ribonuclease HII [Aureitalea marina]PQB05002.1 ribonuclease HII [Aureitalea marina]